MFVSQKIYVGVDPGITGGISCIHSEGTLLDSFSTPTLKVVVNKKNRNQVDEEKVVDYFSKLRTRYKIVFCLEKVNSMPRDGHVGAFSFGMNYGFWRGIGKSYSKDFREVLPKKWQNQMLNRQQLMFHDTKTCSLLAVEEFFLVKLKKSKHGIADAILIAEYFRRNDVQSSCI